MSKIGDAKGVLSGAVHHEFTSMREQLDGLADGALQLSTDCTGINGVSTFWRGLHQQLQAMSQAVREKESEVLATLSGKPKHEILSHVDSDQIEKVRLARRRGTREGVAAEEVAA